MKGSLKGSLKSSSKYPQKDSFKQSAKGSIAEEEEEQRDLEPETPSASPPQTIKTTLTNVDRKDKELVLSPDAPEEVPGEEETEQSVGRFIEDRLEELKDEMLNSSKQEVQQTKELVENTLNTRLDEVRNEIAHF